MFNKELIELQKGCMATCIVIKDEDYEELDSNVAINADTNNHEMIMAIKEKLLSNEDIKYFVIKKIDRLNSEMQDRYYQIVKDREFCGYKLPKDIIIVLTIEGTEGLKNIIPELYHFCVVATF